MNDELFSQGTQLLVVGMGTVFVFLTLLVGATSLMSSLVGRARPVDDDGPTDEEIAAISAAIAARTAASQARNRSN